MRRRSRSLGDRAVAKMVSIAPSSSAGGPDVETAVRTTGPLTAGRKPRGGVFLPECPQRSLVGNAPFPPLAEMLICQPCEGVAEKVS